MEIFNCLAGSEHNIVRLVRLCAVTALAGNRQVKGIGRCERVASFKSQGSGWIKQQMHTEKNIDMRIFQHTVFYHRLRAAPAFFCGLEDKLHRAAQLRAHRAEHLSRSHEHRRMRVVTARVHDARNLGCIGKTRLLL